MKTNPARRMKELVESLRSSGYHGRDEALARASEPLGTLVTAIRQLEVVASHIASAWLDGEMEQHELWQFIKASFLPDARALAKIIDKSATGLWRSFQKRKSIGDITRSFPGAWSFTKGLIEKMQSAAPDTADTGATAVTLLVAVMILRQCADHELRWGEGEEEWRLAEGDGFNERSDNIASEFLERCIKTLGSSPFGVSGSSTIMINGVKVGRPQSPLSGLMREMAAQLTDTNPPSLPSTRQPTF